MGLLDWLTSAERTQQMQGFGNNLKGAIEQLKQQRGLLDTASRDTITSMKRGGSIFPDTPAQRQLDQSIASGVVNSIGPLATVWHGSPHKFDKFDSSKIGTGEGAQAYGHGIYTAEAQAVAKEYADKLSTGQLQFRDGTVFDPFSHLKNPNVRAALQKANGDVGAAIDRANKVIEAIPNTQGAEYAAQDLLKLKELQGAGGLTRPEGHLYKVDLPDEAIAKMLDWDKPLSQQNEGVQTFARQALKQEIQNAGKVADGWGDLSAPYDAFSELTGRDLVSKLRPNFNASIQNITGGGGPEVSNALRNAGIPGIRYLDGGSRGTGAGTSNFVVFPGNESLLTILERNGQQMNLGLGR